MVNQRSPAVLTPVLLAAAISTSTLAARIPALICPLLTTPPVMDGVVEAKEWAGATEITRFTNRNGGADVPVPTRVVLACDAARLYLAAELHFRPGHQVRSFSKVDDAADLWQDDCLEIFLAPDLGRPGAIQLIVNSDGGIYDRRLGSAMSAGDFDLSPRPKVAVRIASNIMHLEMAIDTAAIGAAASPGTVWGVKFCRTHWDRSPTTDRDRPGRLFSASVPGGGSYGDRPYAPLVMVRHTASSQAAVAKLKGKRVSVHPFHGLVAVKQTNVWAKPCARLIQGEANVGERLIFRDQGTGAETWRVTFNPHADGVSYANVFPWNANGSLLMFQGRQRINGNWIMLMNAAGTRIWRPAGHDSMNHPRWSPAKTDSVLCSRGRGMFRIDVRTGEQTKVGELPDRVDGRVSFGKNGRYAVACRQGFGDDGKLTVVDLKDGAIRPVSLRTASADFSGDWLYSGHVTLIGNTPHVGYSLNHLPHLSAEHRYQQWVMNLATGDYQQVRYLSHGGTSPARDRKVGFSGGAIHSTDWFGDNQQFIMQIGTGGHIPWMSSTEWCLAGTSGSPNASQFASQLVQVFVDTGNWCRIAYGQTANTAYGSYLFANTSPDGTKVEYSSTMLGPRDMYWSVMNRPEPPPTVAAKRVGNNVTVQWTVPTVRKEIAGYRVWRSADSGGPYRLVSGRAPIPEMSWTDSAAPVGGPAFYVVTSFEHSTLESRRFSEEAAVPAPGSVGWPGPVRCYIEAETGAATAPLAEDFAGEASADRYIAHRQGEGEGRLLVQASVPRSGTYAVWARVRGAGRLTLDRPGAQPSSLAVAAGTWAWSRFAQAVPFSEGRISLALHSSDSGVAVDKLLVTDDTAFEPRGLGDTSSAAPPTPAGLRATDKRRFDITLKWNAQNESSFHHYQVYRGTDASFRPAQAHLVASPSQSTFLDWGLTPGRPYHYCVTAVDTWGEESAPARLTSGTTPLKELVRVELEAETGQTVNGIHEVVDAPAASAGRYVVTPAEVVTADPYRLALSFSVPRTDQYVVWLELCPVVDTHAYLQLGIDESPRHLMYVQNSLKGKVATRFMWRPAGAVSGATPLLWDLDEGAHHVIISLVGRPGFTRRATAIDRVIVTNDLSFVPEGRTWDW
ncbi:MAG: hypothetical protein HN742_43105 [Lentisphaerae bacterium]|jgi:hypothetical protein|nr:hypothetical protein [Lentisphaerota bacterium]MBT4822260.1 hypothetical protein [Lentisphaerota bacterium]MBT5604297.1 hypothetical protein [Lentisphaerota bacterium]MBT7054467.1 hypothetical protein [Lentisphaerota bacterium]MBT7848727.1 hypothetical protein [Lentisphaerota bacterium]